MAKLQLLQNRYTRMVQDLPRHQLPPGAMWSITDAFPNQVGSGDSASATTAPLRRRGPWVQISNFGDVNAPWKSLAIANKNNGSLAYLAVDSAGKGWLTGTGVASALTGTANPAEQIVMIADKFIMPLAASGGASAVRKWAVSGSTIADLGGSPPAARFATIHKSRLVLGNSSSLPTTVWFSAVQDPETWDADSFITTTYRVLGLASLGTSILVFSANNVEIIRGSTPPSTLSDGDMSLTALFDQGLVDARSIVTVDSSVVWAGLNGVYMSDGAAIEDLTATAGISQHWRANVENASTVAAGVFKGWYIVSLTGSGITYAIRLADKTAVLLQNVNAWDFASFTSSSLQQMWFTPTIVNGASGNAGDLFQIFEPPITDQADGNGGAAAMVVEYPFFEGSPGSRRWKNIYLGAECSVSGIAAVSYVTTSDAPYASYVNAKNDDGTTFFLHPVSNTRARFKVPIRVASSGIGVKVVCGTSDFSLYSLEADVHEREPSRS